MFRKITGTIIFLLVAVGLAFGAKTAFIDGVPSTGVKGTKVTAAFLNAVNKHFNTGLDTDGDGSLAYSAVTGTNDLISTITPTTYFPASYVTGMPIYLKSAATNTGAMTLNINSIGQAAIKKNGSTALVAGDVVAGQLIAVAFDGTNFQLLSTLSSVGTASGYATLDANSRLVQDANTIWDGTAGRTASPTPGANKVPVMSDGATLLPFFRVDVGNYQAGTMPSSDVWYSVGYGSGRFVSVVSSGSTKNAYSKDEGITWTAGGAFPATQAWWGVAYGNGKFVAVGGTGTVGAYSTDLGATWSSSTMPSQLWDAVAYGNGKFVAVGGNVSSINQFAYSPDGINWTGVNPGTPYGSQAWFSVTYGNGKFVALSSTNVNAYSTDGVNWTVVQNLPASQSWYGAACGNGRCIATGGTGTTAAYSTDGISWTASTLPVSQAWKHAAYGNGVFFAVGGTGTTGAYSMDGGATWTATTMPSSLTWNGVAFGNGKVVAVGGTGTGCGSLPTTLSIP